MIAKGARVHHRRPHQVSDSLTAHLVLPRHAERRLRPRFEGFRPELHKLIQIARFLAPSLV